VARAELGAGDRLVIKIGTASLLAGDGQPDEGLMGSIASQIARLRKRGIDVVLVTSGAIAAGLQPLKLGRRPTDIPSLQAAAAAGQGVLLAQWSASLSRVELVGAQMLLTRYDFMQRQQYLNARNTLERLLGLGAVPVVNENDTVAVDEIRFGDNDRLAALVANLARAKLLLLLTDAAGLLSSDPRVEPGAPLVDEVERITPELERAAGGRGSELSSGGMSSKLAAAWVATFSGAGVIIADATTPEVVVGAARGQGGGTYFHPRPHRVSARRLWIAFAQPPRGCVVVDDGARAAVVNRRASLLAVGVVDVNGRFEAGDTVDVADGTGAVFARGLIRYSSGDLQDMRGRPAAKSSGDEVIHVDQLVVLEG
jgi:glutamate 5-kinase